MNEPFEFAGPKEMMKSAQW